MSWTDEKVQKLRELWSKGHTASQIAEALGDTTRNAVIGKAHRLNLEARAPSRSNASTGSSSSAVNKINKQQSKSQQPMTRKQKFQSILLDKNFEPENPKSLEELTESTCKWPIGHPNEENFYFVEGSPKKIFLTANYTFCTRFNLRDKKKMFLIKMMKFRIYREKG